MNVQSIPGVNSISIRVCYYVYRLGRSIALGQQINNIPILALSPAHNNYSVPRAAWRDKNVSGLDFVVIFNRSGFLIQRNSSCISKNNIEIFPETLVAVVLVM
jgi:hypothetical protein